MPLYDAAANNDTDIQIVEKTAEEIIKATQQMTGGQVSPSLSDIPGITTPTGSPQKPFESEDLNQGANDLYKELEELKRSMEPESELEAATKPEHPIHRFLKMLGIDPKSEDLDELKTLSKRMIDQIQQDLDLLSERKRKLQSQNSIEFITKNILPFLALIGSTNPELLRTILPIALMNADQIKQSAIDKLDTSIRQKQADMLNQLQSMYSAINQEERRRISAGQLITSGLRLIVQERLRKLGTKLAAIRSQIVTKFNEEQMRLRREQNIQRYASTLAGHVLRYQQFVTDVLRNLPTTVSQEERIKLAMEINQMRASALESIQKAIAASDLTPQQKQMLLATYSKIFQPLGGDTIATIAQSASPQQLMLPFNMQLAAARLDLIRSLIALNNEKRQAILSNRDFAPTLIRIAMNTVATSDKQFQTLIDKELSDINILPTARAGSLINFLSHQMGLLAVIAETFAMDKRRKMATASPQEQKRIEEENAKAEAALEQLFINNITKAEIGVLTIMSQFARGENEKNSMHNMLVGFLEKQKTVVDGTSLDENRKKAIKARIETTKQKIFEFISPPQQNNQATGQQGGTQQPQQGSASQRSTNQQQR
jgi:hypothetical protein